MDCELYKRNRLVLKTKSPRKGLGCKSSAIRKSFEGFIPATNGCEHQHLNSVVAQPKKLFTNTDNKKNPGLALLGFSVLTKNHKERQVTLMSPLALLPRNKYTTNQISPKAAFEELLGNAFLDREKAKDHAAKIMVVIDLLAASVFKKE